MVMLNYPAPCRHLPARIELGHGSQAGQTRIDQRQSRENPEHAAFQRGIFPALQKLESAGSQPTSIATPMECGNAGNSQLPVVDLIHVGP